MFAQRSSRVRSFRFLNSTGPVAWESLEVRRLLATDAPADPLPDPAEDNNPPQVVAVFANSTAWTPDFRARIEADHQGSAAFGFETTSNENWP